MLRFWRLWVEGEFHQLCSGPWECAGNRERARGRPSSQVPREGLRCRSKVMIDEQNGLNIMRQVKFGRWAADRIT
jgi:hypothetical protein